MKQGVSHGVEPGQWSLCIGQHTQNLIWPHPDPNFLFKPVAENCVAPEHHIAAAGGAAGVWGGDSGGGGGT
jgi:hypothetical protein